MLVTLIGKNSIDKLTLPRNMIGSYWLHHNNRRLINIESVNNKWKIKSTNRYKIINSQNPF